MRFIHAILALGKEKTTKKKHGKSDIYIYIFQHSICLLDKNILANCHVGRLLAMVSTTLAPRKGGLLMSMILHNLQI
jgi:hypothetical protein